MVKFVLQLDHINGINDDYRIENLRILCPNCHSQTKAFVVEILNENVNSQISTFPDTPIRTGPAVLQTAALTI